MIAQNQVNDLLLVYIKRFLLPFRVLFLHSCENLCRKMVCHLYDYYYDYYLTEDWTSFHYSAKDKIINWNELTLKAKIMMDGLTKTIHFVLLLFNLLVQVKKLNLN